MCAPSKVRRLRSWIKTSPAQQPVRPALRRISGPASARAGRNSRYARRCSFCASHLSPSSPSAYVLMQLSHPPPLHLHLHTRYADIARRHPKLALIEPMKWSMQTAVMACSTSCSAQLTAPPLRVAAGGKEVRRWGQKAGLICLRAGRSCPPAPLQIRPAYRVGAGR